MVVVRRRDGRLKFVALGVFVAVFLFVFLARSFKNVEIDADAASLAGFDPGYIISDWQMGNYNSMTEAEIQAFLTAKNPCGNRDYNYYVWLSNTYPNVRWNFKNGHFVCISEERFGDGVTIGSGETAAHIIWQAAQDYRINPQVLIVLLQKEQGLITDDFPHSGQYRAATGYGCPDTAPCDAEYYGFKNQVRKAASLFRTVLDGGWTNYPLGNNYVQYNPSAACGGTVVNIRSLATSALYRYTPYQPNASALAAGYGLGDGCGAYGNRNFYLYFEDWFGGVGREVEPVVEAKTNFERNINDGFYQIYSKAHDNKLIDIRGGVKPGMKSAETLVFSRNSGATDNQIFYIKYNEKTGYYNIMNLVSGLYMDVKGGGTGNLTPIIMFTQNSSCNQDWLFDKDENGYVSIVSRCSSRVLDVASSGLLSIFSGHSGDNQKWKLVSIQEEKNKIEDGNYRILINDNAFDVSGGVYDGMDFGYVVSFSNKQQANQLFNIEYNTDKKVYRIKNPTSKLYLTAGPKLSIQKENGLCNQDWIFEKANENYKIHSACNKQLILISSEKVGSCYAISTELGKGIDVNLERVVDGNIDVNNGNAGAEQLQISENKDYQIMVVNSDKVIDISGGVVAGMQSGNLVVFNARKVDNNNQTFRLKYNKDKQAYYIYNSVSGLHLDAARSGKENGTKIIGFHDNGGECNQLWKIEQDNSGYYRIKSMCSGKLVSVSTEKIGTSFAIALFDNGMVNDQLWKIAEP